MGHRDTLEGSAPRHPLVVGLLLLITLVACGSSAEGPPDGDAGPDANDTGLNIAEPAPPSIPWLAEGVPPVALPMFTPCPEGWHEVVEEDLEGGMDVVTCDPYGDTAGGTDPDSCPDGWAHFMGDAGCTPVGAPCPAGDFPEGLPVDVEVLYVLASAAPGGDGSRSSPMATITDALNVASAGTVVAIGKGAYDEALRMPPGVTLWGACAVETRLTASSPGLLAQGVVTVPSADTRVTNLRIGPADLPGMVVYGSRASMSVDGVIIEGARKYGLHVLRGAEVSGRELWVSGTRAEVGSRFGNGVVVDTASTANLTRVWLFQNHGVGVLGSDDGTSLTLSDLVVRDTQGQENDGTKGRGLNLQFGATAEITRALFWQNRDAAVFAGGDGTSLTLTDVVVRDTQAQQSDGTGGRGLHVTRGAVAEVTRVALSHNRIVGMFAAGAGTSLGLSDVVVRDTQGDQSDGSGGRGMNVQDGATVEVSRAVLSYNRDIGVYAGDEGTSLTLSDVVVRYTQAQASDGEGGQGMVVQEGATVEGSQMVLSHNRTIGAYAASSGTSLRLTDVVVRNTQAQESDGTEGRGLNVQLGATAEVSRVVVSDTRYVSVFVSGVGTSLTFSDGVVRDTQGQESDGLGGRGLSMQGGATAEVSRVVFADNRETAVLATADSTSLRLADVVVRDTQARTSDGTGGRGLVIQLGATAHVTRATLARNRDVGVFSGGAGTIVELFDVAIAQTDEQACASTSCADAPFGVGLAGADRGTLEATRFEVRNSALCGVMVVENGQVDLSVGEVSGSQVGVCLQVDGYAVTRLTDGVLFTDNRTNLDSTSLPVPDPLSAVDDAP